jgi:hypothetical protein
MAGSCEPPALKGKKKMAVLNQIICKQCRVPVVFAQKANGGLEFPARQVHETATACRRFPPNPAIARVQAEKPKILKGLAPLSSDHIELSELESLDPIQDAAPSEIDAQRAAARDQSVRKLAGLLFEDEMTEAQIAAGNSIRA